MIAESEELVLKVEEVGTLLPFWYSTPAWEMGFVKHTHKEFQTHGEERTRLPPDAADNINVNGRGPVCSYCRESGVRAGQKSCRSSSVWSSFSVSQVSSAGSPESRLRCSIRGSISSKQPFFFNTVSMQAAEIHTVQPQSLLPAPSHERAHLTSLNWVGPESPRISWIY